MEIALPSLDPVAFLEKLLTGHLERLASDFDLAIEQWSRWVSDVSAWEDANLLDNPSPENLAAHKATVQRLMAFGAFAGGAVKEGTFIRPETAAMLDATQFALREKLRIWHQPPMDPAKADRILATCFPDEH